MAFTTQGNRQKREWWRSVAPRINELLGAPIERQITYRNYGVYAGRELVAELNDHSAPRGCAEGYCDGAPAERLSIRRWRDTQWDDDNPNGIYYSNRGVPEIGCY